MAKKMIQEIKKETHKLTIEGTFIINDDNTIEIDVPEEGLKNLHELAKNFNNEFGKLTFQTDTQEDID